MTGAAAPHAPVLLGEVLEAMALAPGSQDDGRLVVDATFGAGGYSTAFLQAGVRVIAFDRDPGARAYAGPLEARFPSRLGLVSRPFSELEAGLREAATAGRAAIDGVVFDLGVSSMQLDEPERGFSFMRDGPLDMRMGRDGLTAADIVNTEAEADLIRLFRLYGEEPAARRIARVLVRRREEAPFTRTLDLADTVERAVGGRRGSPTHPATRVFQALRIAVNDELGELRAGLDAAERILAPDGRLVIVAFHSLEDRIVKAFLTERAGRTPAGSRHLPPAPGGPAPSFTLPEARVRTPSEAEIAANPRARSARLRAAIRTHAPSWTDAGRTAA